MTQGRINHKYCLVTVNFPGQTIAQDITHIFCVDTASEYKAVRLAKELLTKDKPDVFSGFAVRKDKREIQ